MLLDVSRIFVSVLFIFLVIPESPALTPGPCTVACRTFDRILDHVEENPSSARAALQLLRLIAEGHPVEVSESLEAQLGLPPTDFLRPDYAMLENRAQAFLYIGKLATSEAIHYLRYVRRASFTAEEVEGIWPASQVALQVALLSNIADHKERVAYLEGTLGGPSSGETHSSVLQWAVNELCNGGELSSLPAVKRSIQFRDSSQRGQDRIRSCEHRMRVLASNSDRVDALGSVLRVSERLGDNRLISWAIDQLKAMKLNRADDELDRFESDIRALPSGSQRQRELWRYVIEMRNRMVPPPPPAGVNLPLSGTSRQNQGLSGTEARTTLRP